MNLFRIADKITTAPGEWRYTQPETGLRVKTRGYNDLLRQVWKHRLANEGLDVSANWQVQFEHDLVLQMNLQGTPWADSNEWHPGTEGGELGIGDLFRFAASAAKILASGCETVPQEEAERRATICAGCPENVNLGGCAGCNGLGAALERVKGKLTTSLDDKLHNCRICKCALSIKVHFPLSSISNAGLTYPEWCWQRAS